MTGELHTVAETAQILKVRESWLKTKASARLVPCTFVGKHMRFSDDDIAEIMRVGARQPTHTPAPLNEPRRLRRTSVAYAEKRGRGRQQWRVKYKLPSGVETSESGFETKAAALAWGRDQEAWIREGRWTDPDAGKITVSEWIDRWLAMQDVGISTVETREYLIQRFIRPVWGDAELGSLTTEDITNWENASLARTGVSRRTARDARALLCTILGDAAAAKPPLIP